MDFPREAVRRQPLRFGVRIEKGTVDTLGRSTQYTMKLNRIGSHRDSLLYSNSAIGSESAIHRQLDHLAVDDPRASEFVRYHAEAFGPERGAEWHGHFAAFGQRVERPLGLGDGVEIQS